MIARLTLLTLAALISLPVIASSPLPAQATPSKDTWTLKTLLVTNNGSFTISSTDAVDGFPDEASCNIAAEATKRALMLPSTCIRVTRPLDTSISAHSARDTQAMKLLMIVITTSSDGTKAHPVIDHIDGFADEAACNIAAGAMQKIDHPSVCIRAPQLAGK